VSYNPKKLKRVRDKKYEPAFLIKWTEEGTYKMIHGGMDFVFSSPSFKDAIMQLALLYKLNKGFEITKLTHEFRP
jgi:hypothetical protein